MFGDENEYSVSSVNSTSALNLAFQGYIVTREFWLPSCE